MKTLEEEVKTSLSKDLDSREIDALANKVSKEILQKFEQNKQCIKETKELLKEAGEIDTNGSDWVNIFSFGIFGKSKTDKLEERANLESKVHLNTIKSIENLNSIVQESIKFTRLNAKFSMAMHSAMAHMIASGVKNQNESLIKISKETSELAQVIMDEADNFAKEQLAQEERHNKIIEAIENQDKVDKIHTQGISENKENIEKNQKLIALLEEMMNEQDKIDKFHTKEIEKNAQNIKKQQKQIDKLINKSQKSSNFNVALALILGILATILSAISLFLILIKG